MKRKGKYGKKISFETIRENKTLDKYEKDDCIIICNRCGKETEWDDDGLCKECHKKELMEDYNEKGKRA